MDVAKLSKTKLFLRWYVLLLLSLFITACVPPPPSQPDNICGIFQQYPNWYWAAKDTQKKWGGPPVAVQMAIIFQESGYHGKAKPPRGKLLWVIPWKRPSTANGYSQALNQTWDNYQTQTGNYGASRTDFRDASDFIGWYASTAHRKAGVSYYNAEALYLAYHEGIGGYQRCTYQQKPWLMQVAKKVQVRANMYQRQLSQCEGSIKKPWWKIF